MQADKPPASLIRNSLFAYTNVNVIIKDHNPHIKMRIAVLWYVDAIISIYIYIYLLKALLKLFSTISNMPLVNLDLL
jgi:hypothetical protein